MDKPADFKATKSPYYDSLRLSWARQGGSYDASCNDCEKSVEGQNVREDQHGYWLCDECYNAQGEDNLVSEWWERQQERKAMGLTD